MGARLSSPDGWRELPAIGRTFLCAPLLIALLTPPLTAPLTAPLSALPALIVRVVATIAR